MTDLSVVKTKAIPAVTFSPDTLKLDKLKKDYPVDKIPPDLTNKDNYQLVKDGKKAHQQARKLIEDTHAEFKKPFRAVGLQLDKAKTIMLADLKPIEDKWKKAKQDHDDIEKKRLEAEEKVEQEAIAKITNKIAWINGYVSRLVGKPSSDMLEAIEQLKADDFAWAGAMVDSAKNVTGAVLVNVENLYKMQVQVEKTEKIEAENEKLKETQVAQIQQKSTGPLPETQVVIEKDNGPVEESQVEKEGGPLAETLDALTKFFAIDEYGVGSENPDKLAHALVYHVKLGTFPHLFFK